MAKQEVVRTFDANGKLHITNARDKETGEDVSYSETTEVTTEAGCDPVVFKKDSVTGLFVKRDMPKGVLNIRWFGAIPKIGYDNATAFAKARAASIALNYCPILIPYGSFETSEDIVLSGNHHTLIGVSRLKSRIYFKGGAKLKIDNAQYAVCRDFSIFSTDGLSTSGIEVHSSPLTVFQDVYVSGSFLDCAIKHGVDSWSCRFIRVFTNEVSSGDGWWFRNAGNNSIVLDQCAALNTSNGVGISISSCNQMTFNNLQVEANKNGHVEFYANTGVPCVVRGLSFNDLYSEQSREPIFPTFKIRQLGSSLFVRGFRINGGFINCFGQDHFADFTGVTNGTFVVDSNNPLVTNVKVSVFKIDSFVRGNIRGQRAFDLSSNDPLIDNKPLVIQSPNNRVNVEEWLSLGRVERQQPILLGPKSTLLAKAGALFYDDVSDVVKYQSLTGADVELGKNTTYQIIVNSTVFTEIKQNIVIAVNATSGASEVTIPPVTQVPKGVQITIKKVDVSANEVTIKSASTIDGAINYILSNQYDSLSFISDGTTLYRVVTRNMAASSTKFGLVKKAAALTAVVPEEVMKTSPAAAAAAYAQVDVQKMVDDLSNLTTQLNFSIARNLEFEEKLRAAGILI